ncbi:sulfur carrier protein ThiS [Rhodococcus gannanensis]|uniref:Sulfur carrier protein ThiS n=1 Tax=Rhodococcus gannanensis TaxID=1960308 RepID=A0ABW4PB35_9NOCA
MTSSVNIGITVNGEDHQLTEELTVSQLLAHLGLPEKGIAVAVDGAVFPRTSWDRAVEKGWEIEILTAVQGG